MSYICNVCEELFGVDQVSIVEPSNGEPVTIICDCCKEDEPPSVI